MYLQGALKTYLAEGWALPVAHTRKQLAECQKRLGQTENYLQTSTLLASDEHLSDEQRRHFCQEILSFASEPADDSGHTVVLPLSSFAHLSDLRFEPATAVVHAGGVLVVDVTVCSRMPVPLHLDHIALHFHFSLDKNNYRKTAEWLTTHQTANGLVVFPATPTTLPATQHSMPAPELAELSERSPADGALSTAGIICRNAHLLLRRSDSSTGPEAPASLALDDGAHVLRSSGITLEPGPNLVTFRTQVGVCTERCLPLASLSPGLFLARRAPCQPGRV